MSDIVNFEEIKRMALEEEAKNNPNEASEPTSAADASTQNPADEDSKTFNPLDSMEAAIKEINPAFSTEELAIFLQLSDDKFAELAPIMMDAIKKDLSNADRIAMIAAFNAQGLHIEDIHAHIGEIFEQMDEQLSSYMSQQKIDFIKDMYALVINMLEEGNAVARRIIQIPVEVCREGAKLPAYGAIGDAGADVYATDDYVINPGEQMIIPTGLKMAIPAGYAILVQPRSGMSAKTKLRICNSPGLVDSLYRQEVGVIVENVDQYIRDMEYDFNDDGQVVVKSILHGNSITIEKGTRFAQLRLVEAPVADFYQVEKIEDDTNRGAGWGSSGTK